MEKTLLETKVEENYGQMQLIYSTTDKELKLFLIELVQDSKELLEKYVDLHLLADDIVDIIDAKTDTGLYDTVDGTVKWLYSLMNTGTALHRIMIY